jgi:alkylhydroperoxidase/carboxymuconolactone decarboxylase family protein YurZ
MWARIVLAIALGGDIVPDFRRRYFDSRKSYRDFFKEAHAEGALDGKTKELMHLALVLALHCEP